MKRTFKKAISLFLAALMLFSTGSVIASAEAKTECDVTPAIIIPGLFQSEVIAYDENGGVLLDSAGNPRTGPFFLDTNEVIMDTVSNVLVPLVKTLVTQDDDNGAFEKVFADTLGRILFERVKSDENGKLVHDIRAVPYNTSFAELSAHDREWAFEQIPLQSFTAQAPEDHLYFFSYVSLSNVFDLADQVYALIRQVKEETGHDKVNIVPISQGGSVFNALLEKHPDVVNDLKKIIYVVPAIDGTDLIGDIYTEGINDSDDSLYGYMVPSLLGKDQEWVGYLANMLLRLLPKHVLNDLLEAAIDTLIRDYLVNSTAMWALVPSDRYPEAREKYLNDGKHEKIMAETDAFYQAQLNARDNILRAMDAGVTVFDICGYNKALYTIAASWDKENADGIIHLDSTSIGATSAKVNGTLPAGYVQQNSYVGITCSDPSHKHIDPRNMVDASTGLLPDHTFYFYGLDHELTVQCTTVINLAVRLLLDDSFTSVYSYPEEYPQFNNFVTTGKLQRRVDDMKPYLENADISEEDRENLRLAIEEAEEANNMTNMDLQKHSQAEKNFDRASEKVLCYDDEYKDAKEKNDLKSVIVCALNKLASVANKVVRVFFGDKGFLEK